MLQSVFFSSRQNACTRSSNYLENKIKTKLMSITTIKLMAMTLTNSEGLLADIFMNVSGASATGMRTLGQSSSLFLSWFGLECLCSDLKCTRCSFKLQNLTLHDESDDVNDDVM